MKAEIDKISYSIASGFNSICNLPIIAELLILISNSQNPEVINCGVEITRWISELHRTKRRDNLINTILETEEPLSDSVKNVDFLVEFIQLLDCATKR